MSVDKPIMPTWLLCASKILSEREKEDERMLKVLYARRRRTQMKDKHNAKRQLGGCVSAANMQQSQQERATNTVSLHGKKKISH